MERERLPNRQAKWALRIRKAKEVVLGPKGTEGVSLGQVEQWQREFQQEHCASCFHYDPAKADFNEKHPDEQDQCRYFATDMAGQCWNYRNQEEGERPPLVSPRSVTEYLQLREQYLRESLHTALQSSGIAPEQIDHFMVDVYDRACQDLNRVQAANVKAALDQMKVPLPELKF